MPERENDLTDEQMILLLNEFAKIDPKAHQLLKDIVRANEFGERDMLINAAHYYLKENPKCLM